MRQTAAARARNHRSRKPAVAGLVVVAAAAAVIGMLAYQSASSLSSSLSEVLRGDYGDAAKEADGTITEADGVLPDGVGVFDDRYPGIANLDPDLLRALREAAADAANEGVELQVNSGWRSPDYQEQLHREAVSEHGSEEEAARWVATANTSAHVSGDAADIGPYDAAAWLSEHGARYGLCQTYRNEPWHYERVPEATEGGCPGRYADAPQPPRIQP